MKHNQINISSETPYRSIPLVNQPDDMVRVVLDMKKSTHHSLMKVLESQNIHPYEITRFKESSSR